LPPNILKQTGVTQKVYKSAWRWIQANEKVIKFIIDLQLCPIHEYINGDYVWYSLKTKKVYCFNHELGTFNDLISKENLVWKATPFNIWLKSKYIDAWK